MIPIILYISFSLLRNLLGLKANIYMTFPYLLELKFLHVVLVKSLLEVNVLALEALNLED